MIYLEEFNHFNSFVAFNPLTGEATPTDKQNDQFFGSLAFLETGLVAALYRERAVLTLQIGREKWAYETGISTSYEHEDGGKTIFRIHRNGARIYEHKYSSWWLRPDTFFNLAEGAPADEEEDYLAYVHSTFEFERAGTKYDLVWHSVS